MHKLNLRALALCAGSIFVSGCAEPGPDTWSYAYLTIVEPGCATSACHSAGVKAGDLDFSTEAKAYRVIAGRACSDTDSPVSGLVSVSSPADSYLLSVLTRSSRPEALAMPPGNRLANGEIAMLQAWIKGGALCE
jgi:hypothetical protein